jgi:hypothetical protein
MALGTRTWNAVLSVMFSSFVFTSLITYSSCGVHVPRLFITIPSFCLSNRHIQLPTWISHCGLNVCFHKRLHAPDCRPISRSSEWDIFTPMSNYCLGKFLCHSCALVDPGPETAGRHVLWCDVRARCCNKAADSSWRNLDLGVDLPLISWRRECRGAIADAWSYTRHTIAWKGE